MLRVLTTSRQRATSAVTLEFRDAAGKTIRTFTSTGAAHDSATADSTKTHPGPRDTLAEKPRGSRPLADDTLAFLPDRKAAE